MFLRGTLYSSAHSYTILNAKAPSFPKIHQPRTSTHLSSFLKLQVCNFPKLQEVACTLKSLTPISFSQRNLSSSSPSSQLISKNIIQDQIGMAEMKKGKILNDFKLQEAEKLGMNIQKLEINEDHQIRLHAVSTVKPNDKNLREEKRPLVLKKERVSSYGMSSSMKKDRPAMMRELSPEMVMLVSRWYEEGYFNKANFEPTKEYDIKSFNNQYSRDFLTFTAEKFGMDHQEIAKWLSGTDMKTVAIFGCPSVEKRSVLAAKRLRTFFSIQEDTVCRSCKLRSSCKFVNRKVWKKMGNLNLADAMKVLVSYSLDWTPQLALPKEVKDSISKLLKEVVNLSQ